ncbi:MAG: hypothetical protein KDK97_02000, partial [Verrucomicrobiales bacterium]|nr:hypothetical protein [Verrucomicrobiales bacterium]
MKTKRFFSAMLLTWLVVISLGASQTRAELQVSFSWFQDSLAPYGEWVTIDDYGPAWHPLAVDETWSPYLDGYWAYTDDGWTWISDEPWADVTYHYGRWTAVDGYGWCWVPGYEWAPAWVSWRANDEYVGWAPLPPEALWQPATGISVWADVRYDIGPAYYHFCHTRDFGERNLRNVVISRDRNTTVIINTTNITNINYLPSENRIFNAGPVLTYVEQRSARPIPRYRIEDHSTFQRSRVNGDAYIAMRPRFNAANRSAGPSLGRSASRHIPQAQVTHGWRHSALPEEQRHIQERMHAEVRGLTPENTPARHVVHRDGGLVPAALAEMRQRAESSARDRQPADSRSSRAGTIPLSPRTPTFHPAQARPTVSTPPKPIERKEGSSKASSSRPQRIDEPHKGPARPSTHPMP